MPSIADLFTTLEYGPAPESAGIVSDWLESRGRRFGHFIGGDFHAAGETFAVHRPSDASELAQVTQGTTGDVDAAVAAARAAQPAWAALGGHGRARHLYALARGIQRRARLFAVLESMDNGKPIRESRDLDIPLVARHFYHHAGWAELLDTEFPGYEPCGVVGQIIPWNFPLLMLAWKVAPALAAGNTVVLKPAEFTPLTALLFAELAKEVGLPAGVFNVVTGDGATGAALVAHTDVDKIAFTGSTDVGRILRAETAGTGKKLTLELGGKSPFVVFDDADLDSVVEGVVDAIWFNQGQVCCAGSRILAQESIAGSLREKLVARMETLRMGDPLDKSIDMGAIVAPVQLDRIRTMVADGEAEGARVHQPSWATPEEGWFYPPTLCDELTSTNVLAREEVFGPVVTMMTFRTPEEAVELSNDTRYGLAASVWTESVNLALDVAPKIKAGTVWVNCTNFFDAASGFGGYRESGYGREGGKEGMWAYLSPSWEKAARKAGSAHPAQGLAEMVAEAPVGAARVSSGIDRTYKLYVGGKQARGDGDYALQVLAHDGAILGEVPRGNRKDVRNAVEAARKAQAGWAGRTAHNRAQILYFMAENADLRRDEWAARLARWSGDEASAAAEVDGAVRRLFHYAAMADKWDGRVHSTPFRNVTLAMPEAIGVMGIVAPREMPLLGLVATIAPAISMGNAVVAVPSSVNPLPMGDLIQLFETSDLPPGVVNFVTGLRPEVVPTLAAHDDVDGVWCFGTRDEGAEVERLSTGNMKRTWCDLGVPRDWHAAGPGWGDDFLRESTQVKNVWIPYGEEGPPARVGATRRRSHRSIPPPRMLRNPPFWRGRGAGGPGGRRFGAARRVVSPPTPSASRPRVRADRSIRSRPRASDARSRT